MQRIPPQSGNIAAVILAAGRGKRMYSDLPKVCHRVGEKPMLVYPVAVCHALGCSPVVVVVSGLRHLRRHVEAALKNSPRRVTYAIQSRPLGTAHAVASAMPKLRGFKGTILVLNGDVPLLNALTLGRFLQAHRRKKSVLSFVSLELANPGSYGRVLREAQSGAVRGVVEERDASPQERRIREVNAGIYAISAPFLRAGLRQIDNRNRQGEYYLPDLIAVALQKGQRVQAYCARDPREFLGINSQLELMEVERVMRQKNIEVLMAKGVRVLDPASTYIAEGVRIERHVTLHPGCTLLGKTTIQQGATLGPYVYLEDTVVGRGARVKPFSVLEGARLGAKSSVGPFAHLRPGAELKEEARVGNFVELKKSVLGRGAKANHLAYLGDATIGAKANIGAGTITCNYDGYDKYKTEIGAEAFIGSDTQLVAPVRVGKAAVVGAGTTVTENVPAGALALSRTVQVNKRGWTKRKKAFGCTTRSSSKASIITTA